MCVCLFYPSHFFTTTKKWQQISSADVPGNFFYFCPFLFPALCSYLYFSFLKCLPSPNFLKSLWFFPQFSFLIFLSPTFLFFSLIPVITLVTVSISNYNSKSISLTELFIKDHHSFFNWRESNSTSECKLTQSWDWPDFSWFSCTSAYQSFIQELFTGLCWAPKENRRIETDKQSFKWACWWQGKQQGSKSILQSEK